MKEIALTRKDASLLYLEMERGGHMKEPTIAQVRASGRLADAFERVLGEYPATKGPDVEVEPGRKVRSWKLDYPCSSFVQVELEDSDWELLCEMWDKIPKGRFLSDRDARKMVQRIEDSLRPASDDNKPKVNKKR